MAMPAATTPPTSTLRARVRGRGVIRAGDGHRAATPLELLFDLTFVVAVSRAAAALHHEVGTGHSAEGALGFATTFFAIWWGWMNYTWFASAHDSDDLAHRLLTLVQMAGVLVLAAGVTNSVEHSDFLVVTIGYGVMRIGLIWSWLRVARDEPTTRTRALRYVSGLAALQVLWFARLALPESLGLASFLVLVVAEVALPWWAERAGDRPIFHAEHIEERYGLFTIIVLGESILSATAGFQTAIDAGGLTGDLLAVGLGGLVVAFGAWWLYFDHPGHLAPRPDQAFRWGYAHVVVFAALAATGAGIHVAIEAVTGHGSARAAALAVAIPVAGYLLGLGLILLVTGRSLAERGVWAKAVGAAVVLGFGALATVPVAVVASAAVLATLATVMVATGDDVGGPTAADPAPG